MHLRLKRRHLRAVVPLVLIHVALQHLNFGINLREQRFDINEEALRSHIEWAACQIA